MRYTPAENRADPLGTVAVLDQNGAEHSWSNVSNSPKEDFEGRLELPVVWFGTKNVQKSGLPARAVVNSVVAVSSEFKRLQIKRSCEGFPIVKLINYKERGPIPITGAFSGKRLVI